MGKKIKVALDARTYMKTEFLKWNGQTRAETIRIALDAYLSQLEEEFGPVSEDIKR